MAAALLTDRHTDRSSGKLLQSQRLKTITGKHVGLSKGGDEGKKH